MRQLPDGSKTLDAGECSVIDKFDGICVQSHTFKILKRCAPLKLHMLPVIIQTRASKFKGMNLSRSSQRLYSISLGVWQSYSVTVTATESILTSTPDINVIELIKKAVLKTNKDSAISDKHSSGIPKKLQSEDLEEVGNEFIRALEREGCECVNLVLHAMGQDKIWDDQVLLDYLSMLNLTKCERLAIHYAQDFAVAGHAVFWIPKDFADIFYGTGEEEPTRQDNVVSFNTSLLSKVGNVQFAVKSVQRFQIYLKGYSEAFKANHRGDVRPFESPYMAKKLFDPADCSFGFLQKLPSLNFNDAIKKIQKLYETLENMLTKSKMGARFEAICIKTEPMQISDFNEMPTFIANTFARVDQLKCLRALEMDKYMKHLEVNLLPWLNTLHEIVSDRKEKAINCQWDGFTPGMYYTVLSCEAVTCLCISGKIDVALEGVIKEAYPLYIADALQLHRLSNDPGRVASSSWIFGSPTRLALMNTPAVQATMFPETFNRVVRVSVPRLTADKLIEETEIIKPKTKRVTQELIEGILFKVENALPKSNPSNSAIQGPMKECAQLLVKCLFYSALRYNGVKDVDANKLYNPIKHLDKWFVVRRIGGRRRTVQASRRHYCTPYEFVKKIMFQDRLTDYGFLNWIIGTLNETCEGYPNVMHGIKAEVARLLEVKLMKMLTFVCLPVMKFNELYIMVPVSGKLFSGLSPASVDAFVTKIAELPRFSGVANVQQRLLTVFNDLRYKKCFQHVFGNV